MNSHLHASPRPASRSQLMASGPICYWSPSPAWEWTKFGNRVACESLVGIRQVRKPLATATSESMSSKWFNGGGLSLSVSEGRGNSLEVFSICFSGWMWTRGLVIRGFVLDQLVILKRFTALSDLNQFMLEVSAYFLKYIIEKSWTFAIIKIVPIPT